MIPTIHIDQLVIVIFMGLVVLAAARDMRELRIPNRVSIAILILYPAVVLGGGAPIDWPGAVAVGALVFAAGVALFAFGVMGGGDVKLMTVSALWAGPALIGDFLVATSLAGGLLAVFILVSARFGLAPLVGAVAGPGALEALVHGRLPYGVAIAVGGLVVGARLLGAW